MKTPFFSWLFLIPICSLFVNFPIFVVSGQCHGDQRSYLLELKNNFKFNNTLSTKLVHWNENTDCCSWKGVTCNGGLVVDLNLDSESIYGGLDNSSSLFCLQYLENLNLANNSFTGSVPSSVAKLTRLVRLDLSSNNFIGSIPNSMANLTQLVYLDMSSNNFTGSISNFVLNLTQLFYLFMSSNNFNGPIPSFNMAKNLTMIDLSHNQLTGQFTSTHWEELQRLVGLCLSHNKLSGQIHEFSNSSFPVVWLDLSSNYLEGPIPTSIGKLQHLESLLLSSNNCNGTFQFSVIQQLTNLFELDLSYNSLLIEYNGTNSSFSSSPLTSIRLASLKLTTFPNFLRNKSSLTVLDLSSNQMHGEIPNWKLIK